MFTSADWISVRSSFDANNALSPDIRLTVVRMGLRCRLWLLRIVEAMQKCHVHAGAIARVRCMLVAEQGFGTGVFVDKTGRVMYAKRGGVIGGVTLISSVEYRGSFGCRGSCHSSW